MKSFLTYFRNKGAISLVVTAFIIAIATTAVVTAAIPDSNSQINACYKNSTLSLRVTDPAGSCASNETALSWNQTGPQGPQGATGPQGPAGPTGPQGPAGGPLAYAHIYINQSGQVTLDTARSKNITGIYSDPSVSLGSVCLTVDGTPSSISGVMGYAASPPNRFTIRDPGGWSVDPTPGYILGPANFCNQYSAGSNIAFSAGSSSSSSYSFDYFVTIF